MGAADRIEREMIKAVCRLLLLLFFADHASAAAALCRAAPSFEANDDAYVCDCACCGEVCPMGAACCCAPEPDEPAADFTGVALNQADCAQNALNPVQSALFFQNAVWLAPAHPAAPITGDPGTSRSINISRVSLHHSPPPVPPPETPA